jgi:hypothetical protein
MAIKKFIPRDDVLNIDAQSLKPVCLFYLWNSESEEVR